VTGGETYRDRRRGTILSEFEDAHLPYRTHSDPDDPVAIFGIASDITERKERAQEITRLNHLHQTVLSNIRETVVVTDDDGQFTYICPKLLL
jgi:PAS domain-containing protein